MVEESRSTGKGDTPWFAMARVGAYTVAGVTGIRVGITKVWDMFYDNFKNYPEFIDLRTKRKETLIGLRTEIDGNPSWTRKEIAEKVRKIENDYGHKFNTILKDSFKIESEGFVGRIKGTLHRFDTFGKYTQAKIGFAAVFSTLAAVGGLVLIERYAAGKPSPLQKLHDDVQAHSQDREQARS